MSLCILSLDLAKNRTGVAYYDGTSIQTWNYGPSLPTDLYTQLSLFAMANEVNLVLIEEHKHFRNAATTRVLIELNGYVHWSFVRDGFLVKKLFPYKSRKRMIDQYANIPDDERDAALLIHEHLGVFEALPIERKSTDEEHNIRRKASKRRNRKSRKAVLDSAS